MTTKFDFEGRKLVEQAPHTPKNGDWDEGISVQPYDVVDALRSSASAGESHLAISDRKKCDPVLVLRYHDGAVRFVKRGEAEAKALEEAQRGESKGGGTDSPKFPRAWLVSPLHDPTVPRRGSSEADFDGSALDRIDVVDLAAKYAGRGIVELAKAWEKWRKEEQGTVGGLFRMAGTELAPQRVLVLVHGTFSTTQGSFGALLESAHWKRVSASYDAVYRWEHVTMSEDPATSALRLYDALPTDVAGDAGSLQVDFITYSRGGLIAELFELATTDLTTVLGLATELESDVRTRLGPELRARVGRVVKVACPSRGTPLLSNNIDRFFTLTYNAMRLFKLFGSDVFQGLARVFASVVSATTDVNQLPGLAAMSPSSTVVRTLARTPSDRVPASRLLVISGTLEFSTFSFKGLGNTAARWLHGGDNDVVVPTPSMVGGLPREGAYDYRVHGPDAHHFGYFRNEKVRRRALFWLTATDEAPTAEMWRGAQRYSDDPEVPRLPGTTRSGLDAERPRRRRRGSVIVVPSVLFTQLVSQDGKIVWYRPSVGLDRLISDDDLSAGARPMSALSAPYSRLRTALREAYDYVKLFKYDWRRSHGEAAAELATLLSELLNGTPDTPNPEGPTGPVHIVAHGSGAYVCQALMHNEALRDVWTQFSAQPDHRIVLLGAPNDGSPVVERWLSGEGTFVEQLGLALTGRGSEESSGTPEQAAAGWLNGLPGLVELLPVRALEAPSASGASADILAQATASRVRWSSAWPERVRFVYSTRPTPVLEPSTESSDCATWMESHLGDGFVLHPASATPSTTYFTRSNEPGQVVDSEGAKGVVSLLQGARIPDGLSSAPPAEATAGTRAWGDREALYPDISMLVKSAYHLDLTSPRDTAVTRLRVDVVHGSMEWVGAPIVVGHYQGTPLSGAEKKADRLTGGHLSQRQMLGVYPSRPGEAEVIDVQGSKPERVIVVGMGKQGALTDSDLRRSMTDAVLRHVTQTPPSESGGAPGSNHPLTLATVLVGTSDRSGLSITEGVQAIIRGVRDALRLCRDSDDRLFVRGTLQRLVIAELYASRAEVASKALVHLAEQMNRESRDFQLDVTPRVITKSGAMPGSVPAEYQRGSWTRLLVEEAKDPNLPKDEQPLKFVYFGKAAGVKANLQRVSRRTMQQLSRAVMDSQGIGRANLALYNLTVPLPLGAAVAGSGNLLLDVDGKTAGYPWELMAIQADLEQRGGVEETPRLLTEERGFLRQFVSARSNGHARRQTLNRCALVLGDGYGNGRESQRLPNVASEVRDVVRLLEAEGYAVDKFLYPDPSQDRGVGGHNAATSWLHGGGPYRIVHIAGHGHYHPDRPDLTGVSLGGDLLTASQLSSLRHVPEVVFLNCCYVGRIDEAGVLNDPGPVSSTDANRLAGNLAVALMEAGAQCVVAAAWAISDAIAPEFALHWYEKMLDGAYLGQATQDARGFANRSGLAGFNTTGGYQVYGAPGFRLPALTPRLHQPRRTRKKQRPASTIQELLRRILECFHQAEQENLTEDQENRIEEILDGLLDHVADEWAASGEVWTRFGQAYGELLRFDKAIENYQRALQARDGTADLLALEQIVNLGSRAAILHARAAGPGKALDVPDAIQDATKLLESLVGLYPTRERLSLLGGHHRRLAVLNALNLVVRDLSHVEEAAKWYGEAYQSAKDAGAELAYAGLNWVAMERVRGAHKTESREALEQALLQIKGHIEDKGEPSNFWDAISSADLRLTEALFEDTPNEIELLTAYEAALARSSSRRHRNSPIEYIRELGTLFAPEFGQDNWLSRLANRLAPHATR